MKNTDVYCIYCAEKLDF